MDITSDVVGFESGEDAAKRLSRAIASEYVVWCVEEGAWLAESGPHDLTLSVFSAARMTREEAVARCVEMTPPGIAVLGALHLPVKYEDVVTIQQAMVDKKRAS